MDIKEINSTSFNSQRGSGWLPVVNQPLRAIGVLFGVFFIMLVLLSVVSSLLIGDGFTAKGMRIFAIVQDLLVFILPAVVAAFVAPACFASDCQCQAAAVLDNYGYHRDADFTACHGIADRVEQQPASSRVDERTGRESAQYGGLRFDRHQRAVGRKHSRRPYNGDTDNRYSYGNSGGAVFPRSIAESVHDHAESEEAFRHLGGRVYIQLHAFSVFRLCAATAPRRIFRLSDMVDRLGMGARDSACVQQLPCGSPFMDCSPQRRSRIG